MKNETRKLSASITSPQEDKEDQSINQSILAVTSLTITKSKSIKSSDDRSNVMVKSKVKSTRTTTRAQSVCLATEQQAIKRAAAKTASQVNQSINQSINQSTNSQVKQPVKPIKRSKRAVTEPKPFNLSANRSARQSTSHTSVLSLSSSSTSSSTSIKVKQSSTSSTTSPVPFVFATTPRHEQHEAEWKMMLDAEEHARNQARCFRAKSLDHVHRLLTRPFVKPVPQSSTGTTIVEFVFALDERVRTWSRFAVEQTFDLAAYRRTLVHSPQPLPSFYRLIKRQL